jgi:hypothetical protein
MSEQYTEIINGPQKFDSRATQPRPLVPHKTRLSRDINQANRRLGSSTPRRLSRALYTIQGLANGPSAGTRMTYESWPPTTGFRTGTASTRLLY